MTELCGRQSHIEDSDNLLRAARHNADSLAWNHAEGRWILNNFGLRFDPDLSTFSESHLMRDGSGTQGLVDSEPRRPIVYSAPVEAIRNFKRAGHEYVVAHTPTSETTPHCAHVSVIPSGFQLTEQHALRNREAADFNLLRTDLALEFKLVSGDITLERPPNSE